MARSWPVRTTFGLATLILLGLQAPLSVASEPLAATPVREQLRVSRPTGSSGPRVAAYAKATNALSFEADVLRFEKPVLVEFWAPWCAACRAIAPTIEVLAAGMRDRLRVVKVNIDQEPELTREFGIRSIPSLLLFRDGKLANRRIGTQPASLITWLRSVR